MATAAMYSPVQESPPPLTRLSSADQLDHDAEDDALFAQIQHELLNLSPGTILRDLQLPGGAAAVAPKTPERLSRPAAVATTTPEPRLPRSVDGDGSGCGNDGGGGGGSDDSVPPSDPGQAELAGGYRAGGTDCDAAVCAICLDCIDEVAQGRPLVVRTNCRHEFHLACLKRNREFSHTCPMCREPLARGLTPARHHASSPVGVQPAPADAAAEAGAVEPMGADGGAVAGGDGGAGDETPEQLRSLAVTMAGIRDGNFVDF